MNTKLKKVIAGAAVALSTVLGVYKWYSPTGNIGIYGNKTSSWITTHAGIVKEVAWKKRQGFNSTVDYGLSDYLVTHPSWVADYVLECRRAGLREVGLVYSKSKTATNDLDYYQKLQKNDSCKFSFVVSEIEQYQKGADRTSFYNAIRDVSAWANKNNIKRCCYQGWPSQTDCDSIVKYIDRIFLHAYIINPTGDACFGYSKSRLQMFYNSMNKMFPGEPNRKINHDLLLSTENPDPKKTQFSYKWFLTHLWTDPLTQLMSYLKTNALGITLSKRIEFGNEQIFVEDQAKQIKP